MFFFLFSLVRAVLVVAVVGLVGHAVVAGVFAQLGLCIFFLDLLGIVAGEDLGVLVVGGGCHFGGLVLALGLFPFLTFTLNIL